VLALARCSACGAFSHPPDVVCPHCGSTQPRFAFRPVEPSGTIRSWTIMRQSFLPGFKDEVPFVLVDVELSAQEDLRLIGRLLDGPDVSLQAGVAVKVDFEDIADGVAVPAFRLETGS
jgi:uncharacterized protein